MSIFDKEGPTSPATKGNCPVCGYDTIGERGMFFICSVCFWEDEDEWLDENPDEVSDGPNGDLTINEARKNFSKIGACELRSLAHVRPPTANEWVEGLPLAEEIAKRQMLARMKYRTPGSYQ